MTAKYKSSNLLDSVTQLYQVVTGHPVTVDEIVSKALDLKIREGLVQSSEHLGKFPMQAHILEDDISEEPFCF